MLDFKIDAQNYYSDIINSSNGDGRRQQFKRCIRHIDSDRWGTVVDIGSSSASELEYTFVGFRRSTRGRYSGRRSSRDPYGRECRPSLRRWATARSRWPSGGRRHSPVGEETLQICLSPNHYYHHHHHRWPTIDVICMLIAISVIVVVVVVVVAAVAGSGSECREEGERDTPKSRTGTRPNLRANHHSPQRSFSR